LITDETLRDGLQSPSITHPSIQDKVYLLYLMRDLGIDAADLGLCCAGERFKQDVIVLAREIAKQGMPIQPQSAARSVEADIAPIVDATEAAGIAIEACVFLGSSPIRQYAEGWELDTLVKMAGESVDFAVKHGLPVMFVTEDTTRAHPDHLRADRVHACGLGIGERSGNTPMEILLVNLNLLGLADRDLSRLPEYTRVISEACGAPIPFNYPIVGADSFRTATGVHASAIVKAMEMQDDWLSDRIYCGVPAGMVGREQQIEIGPMSGEHNVQFWLMARGIETPAVFIEKILTAAKRSNTLLTEEQIMRMVTVMRERLQNGEEVMDEDLEPILAA
jgi:isopropylmalate/homocitrate/citramalate synthase